jgi:hypothetical protein
MKRHRITETMWCVLLILISSSLVFPQNFSGGFNFYLPPRDTGSTRFIPQFPRTPLTDHDFVSINGEGHFSVRGKSTRFFGANVIGYTALPGKSKVWYIAGRMRKMGINLVRFHGMDSQWGTPSDGSLFYPWPASTRQLNPITLDKLDYFLAELKNNGVYADINLHVSRMFTPSDGLPDTDSLKNLGKIINYFDPAILSLHKEYAKQLLTHVNPYIGRSLVSDPLMAMVEITNENCLYHDWRWGTLKPIADGGILTARHIKMLDTLWITFLKSRYGSTGSLASAWNAESASAITHDQLTNGSFENDQLLSPWIMEVHTPASASLMRDSTMPHSGKFSAKVVVTKTDGTLWHLQLKQVGIIATKDTTYLISFAARADSSRTIPVSLVRDIAPGTLIGTMDVQLQPQWNTYSLYCLAPATVDSLRLTFSLGSERPGTYWFDDVSIVVASTGLLPDESLATPFVRRVEYVDCPHFSKQRVRDISSFYLKLEDDYFAKMRSYLKDSLLVRVPISGTNDLFGPADVAVQAKLDYVDNHSYWDHPYFPYGVRHWYDPDWTITNTAMVESQNGGSLAKLMSAAPVSGKPFTISEYNHAWPNLFISEAMLFLTGYGSFQGVDAFMIFDYNGLTDDDWEHDWIGDHFCIHRNPAMMSLVPSCALAYRSGLISPARQTILINYAPDDYLLLPRRFDPANTWYDPPPLNDPMLALKYGVRTGSITSTTPLNLTSFPPTPSNPYVTDTKEITWNTNGLLSIATGLFAGATGHLNKFVNQAVGPLTIKASSGFGTLTWVSLTADSLQRTPLSLLTVSTRTQNTSMEWDGTSTIHDHWGTSPTLVEPLQLTVQLTIQADSVRVFPLDSLGRETRGFSTYMPSSLNAFTITIDQNRLQSMWFGIQAFKGNLRPSFVTKLRDTTIAQNQTLSFTYTVTDFYSDSLKFMLVNPPPGASVTPAGVFSWTPSYAQQGVYSIVVVVSKTFGSFTDTARTLVTVTKINQKPVLNFQLPAAGALTALTRNKPQTFAVSVTDPNGDQLTYTWKVNGGVVKTGTDTSYTQSFVDPHSTPEWVRVVWSKPNGVMPDSLTWNFVITLVSVDENVIPTEFGLAQNYPNPFNPSTNIQFDLPKSVPVTLEIYNILGSRIRTLVKGESLNAGRYTAAWDGRDEGGTSVASGVYICRISAGDFRASKKMALLR